jgi:hypothetical protein
MKTATIPSLCEGIKRRLQSEFIARGLQSRDNAQQTGCYVNADAVVDRLESMLLKAKAAKKAP